MKYWCGPDLERLSDLHFELSNEDRLKILVLLRNKPRKLTEISREIGITHQQCMRHLNRLVDNLLIVKNLRGEYKVTSFGRIVLRLHPSFEFIAKHRDYFATHTLSNLPHEFVSRIGELSNSTRLYDVMELISENESIIKEAEKFLWVIINKRTRSVRPFVAKAIERGVQVKSISVKSYVPSLDVKREIVEADEIVVIKGEKSGLVKVADAEDFPVYMYLTEKAMTIAFPQEDGSFDYTGFTSKDQMTLQYCKDLFLYYWKEVEIIPSNKLVERHIEYLNKHGIYPNYP
jgi:predicted transcriptional regulator